jgi:hypothetical protein
VRLGLELPFAITLALTAVKHSSFMPMVPVAEMAKGQHGHLPDLCTCHILHAFKFIL